MEFDSGYRYSQHADLGYPLQQYTYTEQNAISSGTRVNSRVCPMRAPVGGPRLHMNHRREEDNEIGQRRRVAVACARCRKRKIRCSGDPGDGTGCQNCHSAGLDPKTCAFHRVGSGEATSMMDLHNFNQLANSPAFMLYNTPTSPVRSRPTTYPPALDTRSMYSQATWNNSPYSSEDPSPVEAYGLDQPAAYLPNHSPIAYHSNYSWNAAGRTTHNSYMSHDSALYTANSLPYVQHNIRPAASSETLSNSMTSLQLTLPERPHTRASLPASQRPQLPIPQPSPAQTSRNVVDQMQDQRLRSARTTGKAPLGSGKFAKPVIPYNNEVEGQGATTTSDGLVTQITAPTTATTADIITPATTRELSVSTAPQYNFSTAPLFEIAPTPSLSVYSNFRDSQDYKAVTSPPKNKKIPIPRQASQNNLYGIGSSSSSLSSSNSDSSTLASGHHYTPLSHGQSRPQSQATLKNLAKKPTLHWAPTAVGNLSF